MNPRRPLVSVVIPLFNRARSIAVAVESVQRQTTPDLEVVVVDDASSDASPEIVAGIASRDPRVRLVRAPRNGGAQAARNLGLDAAAGEWLAFLDSDDRYLPASVELRLRRAAETGRQCVHSDALRCSEGQDEQRWGLRSVEGPAYEELLRGPGPMYQCLLIHRSVRDQAGPLDETIVAYQEWDAALSFSRVVDFAFVPEPTFVYEVATAGAISRDGRRGARGYEQIVTKHLGSIRDRLGSEWVLRHFIRTAQRLLPDSSLADGLRLARRWTASGALPFVVAYPALLALAAARFRPPPRSPSGGTSGKPPPAVGKGSITTSRAEALLVRALGRFLGASRMPPGNPAFPPSPTPTPRS